MGPASVRRRAIDQNRAAPPAVLGVAGSQRPTRFRGAVRRPRSRIPESWTAKVMRPRPKSAALLWNKRKEIFRRLPRDVVERDAACGGQRSCRLRHIGGLIALAAELAGGEIRRIGFDQDAVRGQFRRNSAQFIRFPEGQNAGEPNVEPKIDGPQRQFPAGRKAMQHGREGPSPLSSSRIRPISASASRAWTTSGSPVARAAAI